MPAMESFEHNLPTATFGYTLAANQTRFDDEFSENLAYIINVYYTPLLILFGTIGNILSVIVFNRSTMKLHLAGKFLTALSMSDTVFLLLLLPPWLETVQLTELFSDPVFCQSFVYTSYVTCCMSAWLVIAFTLERFVAVIYPLRRLIVFTVPRTRYLILGLFVSSLAVNLPMLQITKSTSAHQCNIDLNYIKQASGFNILDTALSFSVPLGSIIILNVRIMFGVYNIQRIRKQLMNAEGPSAPPGDRARSPCGPACQRSQLRVTRMLLIVSSAFVILNLPAYAMRIIAYAYNMNEEQYTGNWAALQQIALCLFNTNFGINFFLYCLSGRNFRHALLRTIPFLRGLRRFRGIQRAGIIRVPRAGNDSTTLEGNCMETTCNIGRNTPAVTEPSEIICQDGKVIKRWKFDNSRQKPRVIPPPQEDIEMQVFPPSSSQVAGPSGMQQSTSQVPQAEPLRKIPYSLFPYKNLITDRRAHYKSDFAEVLFN